MRATLAMVVAVLAAACSSSVAGPTKVTVPVPVRTIGYDINVPNVAIVNDIKRVFPNGVNMAPLDAQRRWDYTEYYGGSPNIYFGEVSPRCQYQMVGIVVAPRAVAAMMLFTSLDWPTMEPGFSYTWSGRPVVAARPVVGTYIPDIPGLTCY